MHKRAFITGATSQDFSYLAELLLEKGYEIYGLIRRLSTPNTWRIDHIIDKISLIEGDVLDQGSLIRAMEISKPDECYHLAGLSYVPTSWKQPVYTFDVTGTGVLKMLEAARAVNPQMKFYTASSSEMFGNSPPPQNENTPMIPRSPYGVAKLAGHRMVQVYRESFGMFAIGGILFNHGSPRRGIEFIERKITDGVARIIHKKQNKLYLGNLDSRRDFGHARDYMEAAWLMLQQENPRDFVIGSGETHAIKEICEVAFGLVGLNWQDYVEIDPKFFRPAEVNCLIADSTLAIQELGWKPKCTFRELIEEMVIADMKRQSGV